VSIGCGTYLFSIVLKMIFLTYRTIINSKSITSPPFLLRYPLHYNHRIAYTHPAHPMRICIYGVSLPDHYVEHMYTP
jgi:hypothetical protein